jgi:Flp pilus assembly protein TadG
MNKFGFPMLRKFLKDQSGQSAVVVAIAITAITALAATSVEVGHVYYAYQELIASTDQAALAGAQAMSAALLDTASSGAYTAQVTAAVNQYSSESGKYNATSFLQNDTIATQTFFCSTTMSASPFNVECQDPPGSTTGYNAIKVTQTANVPLWFGGLIGMKNMTLAYTATAAMKGGTNIPYNLAIIMDTTASMQSTIKNDKDCTTSQISCAVQGLEVMLENMDPCQLNTTCTAGSPYVDDVALFVFPAVSASFSTNDYNSDYCGLGATTVPYNFTNVTPGTTQNLDMDTTTSTPSTDAGAYEIIPFNDVYKTNDSSSLAATAALSEAVGYSGSGCKGLSAPGGQGTYYAQVIYTAQAALALQQSSTPNSKNIMIILSDGDATACNTLANATAGGSTCNLLAASQIVAENNPTCAKTGGSCLNGTGTSTTNPTGYQSPTYPSALGECGQAVQAAQLATAAGTVVYTIGFGSETTGCTTDQTYTTTSGSTDGAEAWPGGAYAKTPCNAIAAMASTVNTFYSDNSGGCPALTPANANFTSLAQIFQAIVTGLTSPRLIPNGTT